MLQKTSARFANKKNILKVPFFTEIQAETTSFKHNISFIGSNFCDSKHNNIFNNFMRTKPSDIEISQFKELIDEYKKNVFITKEELISKLNITSEKILKTLAMTQLMFNLSAFERVNTLSAIADLGLALYGTPSWATDTYNEPYLILNYIDKPVYTLKHNSDVYNSSKIGININCIQAQSGFSWRVCDILASNACLVSEYRPNIEKYFGKAGIQMFTNPYEAREICKKLLANENMRKDIVLASQEIIDKNFRFKYTKKAIEDFLGIDLSSKTESNLKIKYRIEHFHPAKKDKLSPIEHVFSVKNSGDKKHKILTIGGIKIKIKKKKK